MVNPTNIYYVLGMCVGVGKTYGVFEKCEYPIQEGCSPNCLNCKKARVLLEGKILPVSEPDLVSKLD